MSHRNKASGLCGCTEGLWQAAPLPQRLHNLTALLTALIWPEDRAGASWHSIGLAQPGLSPAILIYGPPLRSYQAPVLPRNSLLPACSACRQPAASDTWCGSAASALLRCCLLGFQLQLVAALAGSLMHLLHIRGQWHHPQSSRVAAAAGAAGILDPGSGRGGCHEGLEPSHRQAGQR